RVEVPNVIDRGVGRGLELQAARPFPLLDVELVGRTLDEVLLEQPAPVEAARGADPGRWMSLLEHDVDVPPVGIAVGLDRHGDDAHWPPQGPNALYIRGDRSHAPCMKRP